MGSRTERIGWIFALILWVLWSGPLAGAHVADDFYNLGPPAGLEIWPGAAPVVEVRFAADEVNATRETSIEVAFNKWDNAGGGSLTFSFPGGDATNYPYWNRVDNCGVQGSPQPNDSVHWDNSIPNSTGFAGHTVWCVENGDIVSFAVGFDEDVDVTWHSDGSNPPANSLDLRSLAAHEAGHVTGGWADESVRGHFDETSAECPETDQRHTMCPTVFLGTAWMRTLEEHVRHTFSAAYP